MIACIFVAATVFAYGQTSSGKTYTMRGITEKAVHDIYKHIMNVSFSTDPIWTLTYILVCRFGILLLYGSIFCPFLIYE